MKKNLLFALLSPFILGLSIVGSDTAHASSLTAKDYQQKAEVQLSNAFNQTDLATLDLKGKKVLTNSIAELSDEEFDRFLYNVVKNNDENFEVLKEKLDEVGVEFESTPNEDGMISINAVASNQLTLTSYSSKRAGDSFWRISGSWDASAAEVYAATEDAVSIEWNPAVGVYYGSTADFNVTSVSDVGKAAPGTVLLHVVDSAINFDGYATVYVTKKSSGVGNLFHGVKYIHTYTTISANIGGEAGISFEKGGPTGGLTFTVQTQTNEKSWQKWDDNDLYW